MADFKPRVFSQTFGVVGGLLEKDGKFLLVRESQRKGPDDGKWSQPAGWIDVGEDPVVAGKREVEEETGVEFTPTALLGVYSLVREDVKEQLNATPHAIKIIFLGDFIERQTKLHDDVTEARWFTPEEIESMDNKTLRDLDIKQMIKDYLAGKSYPLELITHTIAES
ncbi:MAG: NUDIX domain-containing protein [Candidatus Saccharimonadales bacterium]